MQQLRALIRRSGDLFEARLLELDIAVCADSEDGIMREIEYAISLEYQVARDLGLTPFANLVRRDSSLADLWSQAQGSAKESAISLHPQVLDALLIAIHAPARQPKVEFREYAVAA